VRFVKKKADLFSRLSGVAVEEKEEVGFGVKAQEIRYPDPRLKEAKLTMLPLRSARFQLERAIDYLADAITELALAWDEEEFRRRVKIALVDIRTSRLNLEEAEMKLRKLAGL
jgi:hypothetical protein